MKCTGLTIGVALAFLHLGCSEKIPQGPEKVEVIRVTLKIKKDQDVFPQPGLFLTRYKLIPAVQDDPERLEAWRWMSEYEVPFSVEAENVFDETVDGTKWYDIKVHLWEPANPTWRKTLRYREYSPGTPLVLHPGQRVSPWTADSLVWDQTDDSGRWIHETGTYRTYRVVPFVFFSEYRGVPWVRCDTVYTGYADTVKAFEGDKVIRAKAEVQLFKELPAWESNEVEFRIRYVFPGRAFLIRKYRCRNGPLQTGGGS